MSAAQYMKAAEGFDIYQNGAFSTSDYPWYVAAAAQVGSIVANSGAFNNAKSLSFTGLAGTTSVIGMSYRFPSTKTAGRGQTAQTSRGVFGIGFWFNSPSTPTNSTQWLLGYGSSGVATDYKLMGYTQTAAGAPSLIFPTNMGSPTSAPITYPIVNTTWYWIDIRIAVDGVANTWQYEYRVNDVVIASGNATWNSDSITVGLPMNLVTFYGTSYINWKLDDMVIRAASAIDADWVGSNPTVVADIAAMTSRRIYNAVPTANGSKTEWTSSDSGVPNYQAATDPTGTNFVSSTEIGQTDLYKFAMPVGAAPSDISGLVYRGASAKIGSIAPQQLGADATQVTMKTTSSAASHFIGVSEADGATAWTPASLAAAEFGQKSI